MQNGKFYKRSPPVSGDDMWIQSSTMIGKEGWDKFTHLFFMPNGELYGVKDERDERVHCDGRFFPSETNLRLNGNSVLDSR